MLTLFIIIAAIYWNALRSNQSNEFLSLFNSTSVLFLWLQVSGTFLCFTGLINPITSGIVWIIPLLFPLLQKNKHYTAFKLKPLLPFLCLGILYALYATPDPWYRDSLTYHLSLPRHYAQSSGFAPTDEIIFGYFPQGWHALLSIVHSLGENGYPSFNPRYLGVLCSLATALGITGILKEMKCNQTWSISGGLLFLLVPTALEFGASAYVEPWLVLLTLYTVYSALHKKRSAFRVGLLCGMVLSLKYSALFLLILLSPIFLYKRKPVFFLGAAITGVPFYLRNIMLKGNPLFPLAYEQFGGEGWDSWRATAYAITLDNYGMGKALMDFLLLPFRASITQDMTHAFHGSIGPIFLLLLLYCLWHRRHTTLTERSYLLLAMGWLILWSFNVQQLRFAMPAIPLILIGAIPLSSRKSSKYWGALLLLSLSWFVLPSKRLIEAQMTFNYFKNPQEYLSKKLPESHPIYQYLNEIQCKKAWLIWMRGYHYYLDSTPRVDNVFGAYRFEEALRELSPQKIKNLLRTDEISHIVINRKFFLQQSNADRYGEGSTSDLQRKFLRLTQENILNVEKQFGPVIIYSVSEVASDESSSVNEED